MIRKLKKQSELPQEIFVDALSAYKPEDKEEWARHFPPGCRERIAATFLSEVYGSGKLARIWAKEWVKAKEVGDHGGARDLIPTMAAVDSLVIVDRQPEIINSVALERLARRGWGIAKGFQHVTCRADWQKPSGKDKSWVSKVDNETWKRVDPSREHSDVDFTFINRLAEDEVRTEMDRDAALLKARNKLEERSGSGGAQ
jgi:hypothetical protein